MKKTILLGAIAAAISAQAGTTAQLQGATFNVDTLAHYYIGPGVTQTSLRYSNGTRAFNAFAVTLNRKEAGAAVKAKVDVGRDSCKTAEAITSMAKRKTTADRQYLAGINGDFFITSSFAAQHEFGNAILGYPNMSCATEGKMVAPDIIDVTSRENALMICNDGNMYIDETAMKYRVLNVAGDTILDAAAINYPRRANEMVVYNSYMGGWTKTDDTGREIVLRLAPDAKWAINKTVKFVVDSDWRQGGNSQIPADGLVISVGPNYTNKKSQFLDDLYKGKEVKLKLVCNLPAFDNLKPDISEILGGDVRVLKENVTVTTANRFINTPSALYSRSLVGYSEDRNLLVMCAVDAGGNSSGVSYFEAADLMRNLGCWDALDLDGGGSTALWTHSHGMVNTLRDGSERAVGNGFFFVLDAPKDVEVASIRFAHHAITLPKYGLYKPVVYGYNKDGQLVDKDIKGFTLSAHSDLGSVTADNAGLLAHGSGTHALTATLNGMTATMPVTVDATGTAAPRLTDVLLNKDCQWPVELQADVAGTTMSVSPEAFTWESSNPSVASVSATGIVSAHKDGNAVITGKIGDFTVSVNVKVEIATAFEMPVMSTFNLADWTVSVTGVDKNSVTGTPTDGNGFDLGFNVTSTRAASIGLTKDIVMWSHPDKLVLDINPKDATINKVAVEVKPANATRATSYSVSPTLTANASNRIEIPVSEFCDPTDIASYPLTFHKIAFTPASKTGAVALRVNAINGQYNAYDAVKEIAAPTATETLRPVVNGDRVSLGFRANRAAIYSAAGSLVSAITAADQLAKPAAPGLYIVIADGATAKILVK